MFTRRTMLAGLGAAALTTTAAGCGAGGTASAPATLDPNQKVTLTMSWWGNDDRANRYKQAIAEFNKKFPNITVNTQFQAFADYWTARNTEAAGGALPDVMQMDLSYLRQFANNGQLAELDGQVGKSLDVANIDKALLGSGKLKDKLYAIPTSTNTLSMFYNPDVLAKLGAQPFKDGYSWKDYVDAVVAAAPKGAGMSPKLYLGGNLGGVFWIFVQWMIQKGIKPFTDDGKLGFTQDTVKEFLKIFEPLNTAAVRYPPGRAEQLKPKGGFTAQEVATEISWDNFLAGYFTDSGNKNIKMMAVPSVDGKPKMFFKPSMLLAAGANTKNLAAASTLISFLINDASVGKIFGTSKGVPAVKAQRDAMDVAAGSADQIVVKYEETVASLVTEPTPLPVEGFGAIEAAWLRLAGDYSYDKITVDQWADQWWKAAMEALPKK